MLTITDSTSANLKKKPNIIITARCHPSETVSSFVIKGLI